MDVADYLYDPALLLNQLIPIAVSLALAVAIFYIGKMISKSISHLIAERLLKNGQDAILVKFAKNIVYAVLLVVVVIAALDQVGIETTSLLAIFCFVGLAVGLALKDSLSNFASGVMIILFRPFQEGDYIEAGGSAGVVKEVGIFNTIICTGDNQKIIVPNGVIYSGTIANVTAYENRRIDLVIGVGYDDDLGKAKNIIETVVRSDLRILLEPHFEVSVAELAESSVNINVRPWVKTGDYWPTRADLLERIKLALDENNISIPYPQADIHMYNVKNINRA